MKLILGNSKLKLDEIEKNSIDLTITSPPYDNLRDYLNKENNKNLQEDIKIIIKKIFNVTKDGGVCVWIVADQIINGSESCNSFKHVITAVESGFKLHDTMIYKKNATPFPDKKRYYNCFEYMFVFVKGDIKTFNLIKDKKNSNAGKKVSGSNRKIDGSINKFVNTENKTIKEYGVRNNIWEYDVGWNKSYKEDYLKKHPAIFPEKLVEDHIISWSNENDLVLDPFMGTGTVGKVCRKLKREFIGIELNKEYFDIANRRINDIN